MDHPPGGGGGGRTMFPILKNSIILKIMEEVNIPLTEKELTEPGRCKERVREVFVHLLCICRGESETQLLSIPSRIKSKQARLADPELYNDSFREMKFYDLLQKQLRICGYQDFGFKDLAMPHAKRFKRQLSALINFLKYREDMAHLEIQALEEREDLFAALDEVTEIHMSLKDELEEARAAHDRGMVERAEAEAECKEMEAELAQQNKIQASIRQETYLLTKSANEIKDQIANLIISLRESSDLLQMRQSNIDLIRTQEYLTMQSLMPLTKQSMVPFEAVSEPVRKVDSDIILRDLLAGTDVVAHHRQCTVDCRGLS